VIYLKAVPLNWPGGAEENHNNAQSE